MERIAEIERPGRAIRTFYRIGERVFGKVPTPERLMAHRPPLMPAPAVRGDELTAPEWRTRILRIPPSLAASN